MEFMKKEIRFKISDDKHDQVKYYADLFDMSISAFASYALMDKLEKLKRNRVGQEPPDTDDDGINYDDPDL